MKKVLLMVVGVSTMMLGSEIEYGSGSFSMKGGFLGLTEEISTDVTTYSLVERHSNVSDFFYGYDVTWYDSDLMKQGEHTYDSLASSGNSLLSNSGSSSLNIPAVEHRFQGLDVNVRVGYDVIHKDQDNFLGLGLLVGLSVPVLEETSSERTLSDLNRKESDDSSNDVNFDSKTDIKTYKIGPTITFQKSLNKKVSIYGTGSYAYQTGEIENSYADAKYTVDGTFQEYNVGLYFTPFTETYKLGWFSLSPRLYATLGYKYSKWDVDEMAINLSGKEMSSSVLDPLATTFSMESSVGYFGVGYSF